MSIIKENTQNLYSTSDLSLACTIALYFPMWAVDKSNPNHKAEFLFERKENLEQIIENYWKGKLRVDPLKFFNQLKIIKSQLYEKA